MGSSSSGSALTGAASGAAAGSAMGPWGAAIGGAVGAASSLLGANSASKEAARKAEEQRRLQQQQLDFQKQMYDREMGYITPLRDRLTAEAMSEQPLDYARIAGQVKTNYANAARKLMGQPGSGLTGAAQRGMAMNQASTLADAYAQGLSARRNLQQNLLSRDQSAQLGAQYAEGIGNMAGLAGQNAAMSRQAAAQGWQNFGQGLSGIAYGLAAMKPSAPSVMQDTTSYAPPTLSAMPMAPSMELGGYGLTPGIQDSTGFATMPANFNQPFYGQQPAFGPPMGGYGSYAFGRR